MLPGAVDAREFSELINWRKPRFVISVREPCLDRAIKKNLVLIDAKLIQETNSDMKIECQFLTTK
jgi:hypothetical protein